MTDTTSRIPRSIVFGAAKGGVGKTALSTECAAIWAERGRRALFVDTDPQASGTRALGLDPDLTGEGRGLLDAVDRGDTLPVYDSPGRPGLGVVPAGIQTHHVAARLVTSTDGLAAFRAVFADLADRWDAVIFDTGPTVMGSRLAEVVLQTATFLVAPTSASLEDIQGLRGLGQMCAEINAGIMPIGVALMRIPAASTRRRAQAVDTVRTLLAGFADPFPTTVRLAEVAYNAAREAGMLPHEYGRSVLPGRRGVARNAAALAEDFNGLTDEIWDVFAEACELLYGTPAAA